MLRKNVFGQSIFLKKMVIRIFSTITQVRFNNINTPKIEGAELLTKLPHQNILFVSNHQTYFADVAFMMHVIQSALDGYPNQLKWRSMLKCAFTNLYYVAAEETMKSGLLPKILGLSGAISVKRTWREAGKEIKRDVDKKDTDNIEKALKSGWVITFPQGTTKPYVKGRKGTAHIIKNYQPIVVPFVINGFRRAFDKKGMFIKKRNTQLELTVKKPLEINGEDSVDIILDKVMEAIEQTEQYEKRLI